MRCPMEFTFEQILLGISVLATFLSNLKVISDTKKRRKEALKERVEFDEHLKLLVENTDPLIAGLATSGELHKLDGRVTDLEKLMRDLNRRSIIKLEDIKNLNDEQELLMRTQVCILEALQDLGAEKEEINNVKDRITEHLYTRSHKLQSGQ